jgi:hypothetical protein
VLLYNCVFVSQYLFVLLSLWLNLFVSLDFCVVVSLCLSIPFLVLLLICLCIVVLLCLYVFVSMCLNVAVSSFLIRTRFLKSLISKTCTFLALITTKGNKQRRRKHGVYWMSSLTSNEFRRAFRMSKKTFYVLLKLVHDDLKKDHLKAQNSSGSPITPLVKLAATIRWLAGGMYIDICAAFGLCQTTFFHPLRGPLWPTIYALDVALANMVIFPTDVESCNKAAKEFSYFSRNMLQHCVCAVDGTTTNVILSITCTHKLDHHCFLLLCRLQYNNLY